LKQQEKKLLKSFAVFNFDFFDEQRLLILAILKHKRDPNGGAFAVEVKLCDLPGPDGRIAAAENQE